ncbi:hypothetical protein HYDPIDRAFT_23979 [Hydnomerulius pinastri MD-312]|nr:hypothetical protein HYDPIDRAFT_23979 [Hydnomerulius pinastri MD-312]
MSIASPTLIPRPPIIPLVLPKAPHVGPTPLPKADRFQGRINHRRDWLREADDLSEEEDDLEDCNSHVRTRGFVWYIPIGRHTTQLEEKNDAEEESDESSSGHTDEGSPPLNEENDDSGPDLDASMEDMDEEPSSEVEEGITEEFEEEPSEM